MKIRLSAVITALLAVAISTSTLANDQLSSKSGVLHHVDFANQTLSIIDEQGNIEAYNFDSKLRTIVEGRTVNSRRVLKAGQKVEVKIRANDFAQVSL
jgi:hypothetical protein